MVTPSSIACVAPGGQSQRRLPCTDMPSTDLVHLLAGTDVLNRQGGSFVHGQRPSEAEGHGKPISSPL